MRIEGVNALVDGRGVGARRRHRPPAARRRAPTVTIADLDEEHGQPLADELGGRFVRTDVTDEASVAGRGRRRGARAATCASA